MNALQKILRDPERKFKVYGDSKPFSGYEYRLQTAVAKYFDAIGLTWCHIANERQTSGRRGNMLKAQGVKAGMPDCLIFHCTPKYLGIAIELKTEGDTPSEVQITRLNKLSKNGWGCYVCYSWEGVVKALVDAGLIEKGTQTRLVKHKYIQHETV